LYSRGLHAQVTGRLVTLNNILEGVCIAGGFMPQPMARFFISIIIILNPVAVEGAPCPSKNSKIF
jgi:hypothetical protein